MDSKWIIMHFLFSPIMLSERDMGIDYIYNFIDHENPL